MPINPTTGDYLSGIAGSGVWLNGQQLQLGPSGYPQFWPTGYAFNFATTGGAYNILTNTAIQLSTMGAAPLYAGGGVWLAALLGGAPTARSSWGFSSQQMPLGVSPQGRIFVTIGNYPNDPYGIQGYDPDTTQPANLVENTAVMPGPANFFALDSEHAIWLEVGLTLRAGGYPTQPVTVSEGLQAQAAPMLLDWGPNGLWVAYVTQSGRGVCHPYSNASKGFEAPANAFGFRVWAPSSNEIELCWTGNVGETGPVTRVRYNVSAMGPLEPVEPPIPPIPPIPPEPPGNLPPSQPIGAKPMKIALKLKGKYLGLEPGTEQPYANRDAIGGWEEIELTQHKDGYFDALFIAANRQFTLTPDGDLQSRPAGTFGSWESFFATEQPDGSKLCYRIDQGNLVQPALNVVQLS